MHLRSARAAAVQPRTAELQLGICGSASVHPERSAFGGQLFEPRGPKLGRAGAQRSAGWTALALAFGISYLTAKNRHVTKYISIRQSCEHLAELIDVGGGFRVEVGKEGVVAE